MPARTPITRPSFPWLASALIALASGPACDPGAPPDDDAAADDDSAPPGLPFLSADGPRIVDEAGAPVVLRGVNLGAWLYHETWISAIDHPFHGRTIVEGEREGIGAAVRDAVAAAGEQEGWSEEWLDEVEAALDPGVDADAWGATREAALACPDVHDDSDLPLRAALESRFGVSGRDAVLDAFTATWITEDDVAAVAALGGNVVRVPTGYRPYLAGSDGDPITLPLTFREETFDALSRLLDACAAHGVYAVVDLQESPGGHNDYSGEGTLYEDPEMQEATVALWAEIASRFKDRPEVAAWSLLAEPMSAPSTEAMVDMYDRLHDAVRATGDEHLLVVHDGFRGMWELPVPGDLGWTGVVYSTHLFEWGAEDLADYQALAELYGTLFDASQGEQGVPYFIGSFSTMRDEAWAYDAFDLLTGLFAERGWSWSMWTWKRVDDPWDRELWGSRTAWGVYRDFEDGSGWERADVCHDSQEELVRKLGTYGLAGMAPNAELSQRLSAAFLAP
ncbi:glycoside hydrolase family 5 protein [Myxococcota bacterium]|nr:glycoside hydrolase family 5 protein [Myxococcota bacterium]